MPIPINLLAEAQAAEEMRRRDPVKRGIWIGGFLVCLVLLWIGKLQMDIFFEMASGKRLATRLSAIEDESKLVRTNQKTIIVIEQKLAALDRLSTNRFLWANVLNALQQTTVDNVQLSRIRTEQTYTQIDAKMNEKKTAVVQPAAMVEKKMLNIEAKDWNSQGETYKKYQETLANFDYFVKVLRSKDGFAFSGALGPPMPDLKDPSRRSVAFSLDAVFPEAPRYE